MKSPSNTVIERRPVAGGETLIVRGDEWQVSGAGGAVGKSGGSSGKGPVEDPDSMRSIAYASVVYLLGEGEIVGPASGDFGNDLYLNDTPMKNANGDFNFTNFVLDFRAGLPSQTYMPGFADVSSDTPVSVKLTASAGAIVRTVSDPNADAVSITMMTPQFQDIDDKGNQRGSSVTFRIDIATNGGSYVTVATPTISGKRTSNYQRAYRIQLPKPGSFWQIRLVRLTPDSTSNRITNDLFWQTLTTIIESKLTYRNRAMLALRISAEQFNSIPKVGIWLKGIKMKIPSNYNPVSRTYTGTWDGTWGYDWSDNPAWILYDLLTEPRYGCGKYIQESQVDKWALYTIAQYCDQLVPNGKGGFEPRFTFNAYIQNAEEVYNVINSLVSTFRGMAYWSSGSVTTVQDSPTILSQAQLFSDANVIQQVDDQGRVTSPPFTYSGSGRKARHTVAIVEWYDPNDFCKPKQEYVVNRAAVARYGYLPTKVIAFGCTSQGQAHRFGLWTLYTEQYETEILNFLTGTDGMLTRPGKVIKVADSDRAGSRIDGRILSATTTVIGLDASITIPSGTVTLSITMPDGTTAERTLAAGQTGTRTSVTLSSALPSVPPAGSLWVLTTPAISPQTFRVITVTEKSPYTYSITALAHNPSKYAAIEQGLTLDTPKISNLAAFTQTPSPPGTVFAQESLYESRSAGIRTRVDIGFSASPSPGIDRYQIEVKASTDPGEFAVLGYSTDLNYPWLNVEPGTYLIRVCAINKLGLTSAYTEALTQVAGLQAPPANVSNLVISVLGESALLRWDKHPDLDVQAGGFFRVKFTPKTTSYTWSDGYEVAIPSGASNLTQVPLSRGTYMIKAVDSSGNESTDFTAVDSSFAVVQNSNVVQTIAEHPNFLGARFLCTANQGFLQLSQGNFFDANYIYPTFDSAPGNFDAMNADDTTIETQATYLFSSQLDLGDVYLCKLIPDLSAIVVDRSNVFDKRDGNFDSFPGTFDGQSRSGATAKILVATSQDGINFSPLSELVVGEYSARAFHFECKLSSDYQSLNILIDRLGVIIDMPDREEKGILNSTTSIQTVTFANPFWTGSTPVIGAVLSNGNQGDYFLISNVTNTGFQVQVFDSSNTGIAGRKVNWIAKGYGRKA